MRLISLQSALLLGCIALPLASGSEIPRSWDFAQDGEPLNDGLEELEAQAEKFVRARKPAERDAAFDALFQMAEDHRQGAEILDTALTERWQAAVKSLESAKLEKKFARLLGQRERLDLVRKDAVSLIEDETKYFYPYRQPEVSADKASQYPKVQAEVSKRVRILQEAWEKSAKVKLPKSVHETLAEMDWLRTHETRTTAGFAPPESMPEWIPLFAHRRQADRSDQLSAQG